MTMAAKPAPLSSPATADWFTVVARDAESLAAHVPAWEALAEGAEEPNVFYEPWMLLPALGAFGKGIDFRIVLVYAPHRTDPKGPPCLCGLFPLARRRSYKGLPGAVLRLWNHDLGLLGTPLVRAGAARPCLETLVRSLANEAGGGPLLELATLAADGPFYRGLLDYLHEHRGPFLVTECWTRALFRRRHDSEAYLQAALPGEQRKGLRRKAKRLAEQGKVEFRALESAADFDAWIEAFLKVEASGWKGRAGTALASTPAAQEFFQTAARAAWDRGRLGLVALHLDGRPIACQCYFLAGPGAFAFKTAYDEAYGRFSPGVLIQLELIRRLHQSPMPEWMDSNAEPDSYLNALWPERRAMQTVLVATGKAPGDLVVSALPLLKWLKNKLRRCWWF